MQNQRPPQPINRSTARSRRDRRRDRTRYLRHGALVAAFERKVDRRRGRPGAGKVWN